MYDEVSENKVMSPGWRSEFKSFGRLEAFKAAMKAKHGKKYKANVTMDILVNYALDHFESAESLPQASLPAQKTVKQVAIDTAADDFEIFWLAGMVKVQKKKAFSSFKSLAGKNGGSLVFAEMLSHDVYNRLDVGQLGFDALHPTTYLNGERWNDEIKAPASLNAGRPQVDQSGFGDDSGVIDSHAVSNQQGWIEHG